MGPIEVFLRSLPSRDRFVALIEVGRKQPTETLVERNQKTKFSGSVHSLLETCEQRVETSFEACHYFDITMSRWYERRSLTIWLDAVKKHFVRTLSTTGAI